MVTGGQRNELSDVIPGYTAPLSLLEDSTVAVPSLQTLRKRTLAKESKQLLSKTSSSSSKHSYRSFKTGKRLVPKAASAGDGWFNMRPTPMSDALKKDVAIIRNRNYLDPKRFYKNPDKPAETMQLGTVVEGATEFYSSRMSKKERRANLTDELLVNDSAYAVGKFKSMEREKAMLRNKKKRRKGRR